MTTCLRCHRVEELERERDEARATIEIQADKIAVLNHRLESRPVKPVGCTHEATIERFKVKLEVFNRAVAPDDWQRAASELEDVLDADSG